MARAMRPVVILMLLATVLFVVDGILDHNYANQPIFDEYKGVGWTSFVFAIANLLMTIAVARGSERTLLGRIALSAFFIVERPLTAFVLGPKPVTSVAVHMATAVVELIILVGAIRVWQLGHSLVPADMDAAFALDSATPRPDATLPVSEPAMPVAPEAKAAPRKSGNSAWLIGVLTLLLAAILVADGMTAGFFPGSKQEWGTSGESSGWLVYLFALVILTVATRAVHGGSFALRLLMVLALIFFIEPAFSPFALKVIDPAQLGLHGLAAFIALALALATASVIRSGGRASASSRRASSAT
jgi:hypothetical protein